MKRVIGFALLCIAVGMLISMMLPAASLFRLILFLGSLAAGYCLFCK